MRGLHLLKTAAVSLAVLLTSCSAPTGLSDGASTGKQDGSPAIIDEKTFTAKLPLDSYISQDSGIRMLYLRSQVARISGCIKARGGSPISDARVAQLQVVPQEDRTHGQWDVASAKKYGFELNPERGIPTLVAMPWQKEDLLLVSSCYEDLVKSPTDIDQAYSTSNLADELRGEAIQTATESAEGRTVHSELRGCLASHNLAADDHGKLDSKYFTQTSTEQIVTASTLAQCNFEKRVPQQLFALQAKHEAALIANHQEELAAAKNAKLAYVKKLEASINAN